MDFEDQFCGAKGTEGELCFLALGHDGAFHDNMDVTWARRPDDELPSGKETHPEAINNALRAAMIAKREGKW
jgi:hypothetical protein